MDDIDIYRNSSLIILRKTPPKICSWIVIIFLSIVTIGSIITLIKYDKYIVYDAVINEGLIEIYVEKDFFDLKTNQLKINEKGYKYKINEIEPFVYRDNEIQYWKVLISVSLPEDWIIDNNHIQIYFNRGETTFLEEIIKSIKKGMRE